MVTKNQIKLIKSLHQKKYRKQHQLFIAEGVKVIQELLNSNLKLEYLYVTEALSFDVSDDQINLISTDDLKKITALNTPNNCLAVFKMPEPTKIDYEKLVVALDTVRDPGNMGTIIRLCDWFGVKDIICSSETVDLFNPKVVQATMGSLSRVNVTYGDLASMLAESNSECIFGTFMDGASIYQEQLPDSGILVLGNEANGISPAIEQLVQQRLTIPRFGDLQQTESLNVAMATAICLSEFKRISEK